MKHITKILIGCLLAVALVSCGGDPDETIDIPDDPIGTELVIQYDGGSGLVIHVDSDYGTIGWIKPSKFNLRGNKIDDRFLVSICDLGEVLGLGSITEIPNDDQFTTPATTNSAITCEMGYGYVLKFTHSERPDVYVRLYVVEYMKDTSGNLIGAKFKLQYPFEP